jgi:hypothetical protein
MKKPGIALFSLLLGGTSAVQAASIVDLAVTGLITPTACPQLSDGAVIDYGKISQQDLKVDRSTRLPVKPLHVNIACNAPNRFALRMHDNRDGSAMVNSEIYYGLGLDHSGNRIGLYSMTFDPLQTVVDSTAQAYGTVHHRRPGLAHGQSQSDQHRRQQLPGLHRHRRQHGRPSAIQTLSSTVKVETLINATQNLDLSRETALDGLATLEVVYL